MCIFRRQVTDWRIFRLQVIDWRIVAGLMSSPDPFQEAIQLAWTSFVLSIIPSQPETGEQSLRTCESSLSPAMSLKLEQDFGCDLTSKKKAVPLDILKLCKWLIESGSEIIFAVAELTEGLLLVELGDLSQSIDVLLAKAKSRNNAEFVNYDRQRDASGLEAIVALMEGDAEEVEEALSYFERENLTNITLLRKQHKTSTPFTKISVGDDDAASAAIIDESESSAAHEHAPTLFFPFRNLIGTAFDGKFASMYARDLVVHFCGGKWFLQKEEASVSLAGSVYFVTFRILISRDAALVRFQRSAEHNGSRHAYLLIARSTHSDA
jgi:hypothetical protein